MHVFLSHSSRDRDIAAALKCLLQEMFGADRMRVEFSSDQQSGGGIPPGAQWFPWIQDHIERADRTYVLLTPQSVTRPWVLWEAGAAAGVALALDREAGVVPITFGIEDDDIPSPLSGAQWLKGDVQDADGIVRLLQQLNADLGRPLSGPAFKATVDAVVPAFLKTVAAALEQTAPPGGLLASVPHNFPVERLAGTWVTCYQLGTGKHRRCFADIAQLTAESDRRVRIRNYPPEPRAEGQRSGFRNEIEAELTDRHLIGQWRNVNDTRYFGSLQLAIQPGENIMEGRFTSFQNDVTVTGGRWRWVRLRNLVPEEQLAAALLKEPGEISALVDTCSRHAAPLDLSDVVQGA